MGVAMTQLTVKNFVISQYKLLFMVKHLTILPGIINSNKEGNVNSIMLHYSTKVSKY